ncbi:MAG: spore maturation protein [Clostridia bacterium]|nr:spore maturation protein [Clostridia bacterium]
MTDWIIPLTILLIIVYGAAKKVDIYAAMTHGIGEGVRVCIGIFPAMVIMLTVTSMFKASGGTELFAYALTPCSKLLNIPVDCIPLALLRPFTGSGALSIGSEIMSSSGADSYTGRVAAVMLGASETSFYTIAVYSAYLGLKNTAYTLPAALCADFAAFVMSGVAVRLLM